MVSWCITERRSCEVARDRRGLFGTRNDKERRMSNSFIYLLGRTQAFHCANSTRSEHPISLTVVRYSRYRNQRNEYIRINFRDITDSKDLRFRRFKN